jgi:hypothetical protein
VRQLKYEFISYSPEDLVDIANKEFAWCDAELLKAPVIWALAIIGKALWKKLKKHMCPGKTTRSDV